MVHGISGSGPPKFLSCLDFTVCGWKSSFASQCIMLLLYIKQQCFLNEVVSSMVRCSNRNVLFDFTDKHDTILSASEDEPGISERRPMVG